MYGPLIRKGPSYVIRICVIRLVLLILINGSNGSYQPFVLKNITLMQSANSLLFPKSLPTNSESAFVLHASQELLVYISTPKPFSFLNKHLFCQ